MSRTEQLANIVGLVTLAMGTGLTAAPKPVGKALGLGEHAGFARTIGIIDLALTPGLLRGHPRWPWMAGRAALNLVIANHYRTRRAPAGMAGMAVLAVVDGGLAVALKSRNR
ncbi:hypothetical protein MOQ72_25985 [Saccharopolyspora sp. K220]|uniref:hypothetical protein n=1 Tax=Saccharopolyspora soli TaxID=2926618 RepID=UPI001F579842|nr:hypothetical protein [Saccharopolyspora soli]MCI2420899.1 hypothetical protein [Saccharopolyspora soli]